MLVITLVALLGAFSLTLFAASLRKAPLSRGGFFYGRFQKLFFQKKETERTYAALRLTRILLLLLFMALIAPQLTLLQLILAAVASWLFIDVLPALLGYRYFEKTFALSSPIASLYLILFAPLSFPLMSLSKRFVDALAFPWMKQTNTSVTEKVIAILEDGEGKAAHDKELIHAVIAFKDRIAREVMIPRVHLFALPVKTTIKEAALTLLQEGYSRIPVYKDSIDEILGILMYKDVLRLFIETKSRADLEHTTLEGLVKPILFTPETKKVTALLQDFRAKQMHMAIVVDEYGGTEGLVTIEDILEEIVGEIADEYDDQEELLYREEDDGSFLIDPRMSILDIQERFGIRLPQEGDYDTIGGYIFHKAGAIPRKGFHISHDTFDLEVLSATERSISQVRLIKRGYEDEDD